MFCLSTADISKVFAHKKALDKVSLSIRSGSIHALLGENGAGKSTLASILSGSQRPSSGSLLLGSNPYVTESVTTKTVSFFSPQDAQDKGIVMVHQKPFAAGELTVLENCTLGLEKSFGAKKRLEKIKEVWKIPVPLNQKVKHLHASQIFYTELLCALIKKPRLLILDEPSAYLDEKERIQFFTALREQADNGLAVLFITHNIEDALKYADTVSVLKKGELVLSSENTKSSPLQITPLQKVLFDSASLKHREDRLQKNRGSFSAEDAVLKVNQLTCREKNRTALFSLSFTVYKSSITLIRGQRESGIETLEEILCGVFPLHFFGSITLQDRIFTFKKPLTPRIIRESGGAVIPSNKTFRASHPDLTILEMLTVYGNTKSTREEDEDFSRSIIANEMISIDIDEPVKNLSGGMLQRLILEREISTDPEFLFLFEPAAGLDKAASLSLCKNLRSLADTGCAVLVVSSSADECLVSASDIRYQLAGGKFL